MQLKVFCILFTAIASTAAIAGSEATNESSFSTGHDLNQVLVRVRELRASNNVDEIRHLFLEVLTTPCQTNADQRSGCLVAKRPIVEECLNITELQTNRAVLMAVAQHEGLIKSLKDEDAPQVILQNVVGESPEERARWNAEHKVAMEAQTFQRDLMHADVGIMLAYFCSLLPDTDPDKNAFLNQIAETAKLDTFEQEKMRAHPRRSE